MDHTPQTNTFVINDRIKQQILVLNPSSLFTYLKLKKELNQNIQILETYKKETKELQENVKKLKIETLDLDYLDEVARDKHDLSKPDENIIFNK